MPTLNWLTREADLQKSRRATYRLLEPVPEMGYGDPAAGNLLIQGDNLDALKALLPYYAGRVKCIYIDPPYNTKSAFEHYDDNLEHSQWLSMIYPRRPPGVQRGAPRREVLPRTAPGAPRERGAFARRREVKGALNASDVSTRSRAE
jgi:hypothetical protein